MTRQVCQLSNCDGTPPCSNQGWLRCRNTLHRNHWIVGSSLKAQGQKCGHGNRTQSINTQAELFQASPYYNVPLVNIQFSTIVCCSHPTIVGLWHHYPCWWYPLTITVVSPTLLETNMDPTQRGSHWKPNSFAVLECMCSVMQCILAQPFGNPR